MSLLFTETMLSKQLNPSKGSLVSHQFLFCIHNLLFPFVGTFTSLSKLGLPNYTFLDFFLETLASIPCSGSISCFVGEIWTLVACGAYCQRQLWILMAGPLLLHLPAPKKGISLPPKACQGVTQRGSLCLQH